MADVARKVLGWRLRLMPYLYSAFYDSHALGCPVARPQFFNFPSDPATLRLREQWMMGAPLPPPACALPLWVTCAFLAALAHFCARCFAVLAVLALFGSLVPVAVQACMSPILSTFRSRLPFPSTDVGQVPIKCLSHGARGFSLTQGHHEGGTFSRCFVA